MSDTPRSAAEMAFEYVEKLMESSTSAQEKSGWLPDYKEGDLLPELKQALANYRAGRGE